MNALQTYDLHGVYLINREMVPKKQDEVNWFVLQ